MPVLFGKVPDIVIVTTWSGVTCRKMYMQSLTKIPIYAIQMKRQLVKGVLGIALYANVYLKVQFLAKLQP